MRKYSAKDHIIIINSIEENIDVKDWNIEGINIWPVVRLYIVDQLTSDKKRPNSFFLQRFKTTSTKIISIIWYNLLNIGIKGSRRNKYDVLFLGYSVSKQYKSQIGWVDVFLHPIVNVVSSMNYSFKFYEYIGEGQLKFPGHFPSKIIDISVLKNLIQAKFNHFKINMKDSHTYIILIEKHLKEIHNIELSISEQYIRKRASQILSNYHFFNTIIRKHKPKLVFTTSYTSWGYSLSLACNNSGIKCIDVQHGVQGNYSAKYGSWKNVPKQGFNILPQVFAVWDEYELMAIQSWSMHTIHQAVLVGNMTMRLLEIERKTTLILNHEKVNILITLQKNRDITKLISELLSKDNDKFFWWIRSHPRMTKNEVKSINKFFHNQNLKNFNIKDASVTNLFYILNDMDVHITEFSTVTIQAAWFNVPTILTHKTGIDIFQNEIDAGKACYIEDADTIIERIVELDKKESTSIKINTTNEFESNMRDLIDSIKN